MGHRPEQMVDQLTETARGSGSRSGLSMAHMLRGISCHYYRGDLAQARQHYEAAIASYVETEFLGDIWDPHVRALSQIALVLSHSGKPYQAKVKAHESVTLADRLKSPLGGALYLAAVLYIHLRDRAKWRKSLSVSFPSQASGNRCSSTMPQFAADGRWRSKVTPTKAQR